MSEKDAPLDCWTCRHRVEVISGPQLSAFVTLSEQRCRAFRNDLLGAATPMPCSEAYDEFCGGGDWKPTLWARIGLWLGMIK